MQAASTHLPSNCLGWLPRPPPRSCSSCNILWARCICTHWNHAITACQSFLCQETFAYSNVLTSEPRRGWFSNVHIHMVDLCSCFELVMNESDSFFATFVYFFIIILPDPRSKLRVCLYLWAPPARLLCLCMRANSLIPMHKHISDLRPIYSPPSDTIGLQIKDNGTKVNSERAETHPAPQLYHIKRADVQISFECVWDQISAEHFLCFSDS